MRDLSDFRPGLSLRLEQQWTEWFQPCGWQNFSVLEISFENDVNVGYLQLRVVLLGLVLELQVDYANTEFRKRIISHAEELARSVGGDLG